MAVNRLLWCATLLLCWPLLAQIPVKLSVDATDAPRHLFHAKLAFPVKPGPFTLLYPQWIPGEHGPTGPIADVVGLKISAAGQTVPWKRDSVNMYAFHMEIPPGATTLDVALDFISPPDTGAFSAGGSATSQLAVLSWNQLLLYPDGAPTDRLNYQATLKVPPGWRYGTALAIARETGDTIVFKPSSLTTLIDSPVLTGTNFKTVDLSPGETPPHYLHIAADSERATEITEPEIEHYRNLVKETGALFGARHYRDYHFLLTLSDHVAHFGLEHHESSDDRVGERSLVDDSLRKLTSGLLPHEFVHSWNGKYRRPAGLATSDYEKPMKGDLLWVYEGLTEYLGEVLTPRSGLSTPEQYRESLAITAAQLDRGAGRTWRPLEDTAIAAQILYGGRADYADYRRGVDYYPEGTLIWLDADVSIRQLSRGKRSLDDFVRAFDGGQSGPPAVRPYTFEDVVAGLNAVQPNDWAEFLNTRLKSTAPHAPLGGITGGGWNLVYTNVRSGIWKTAEEERKFIDMSYSLGIKVKEDGTITDVHIGSPAQKAGVAPEEKLIAVNTRQFTGTALREAIQAAAKTSAPIELLIKDGEFYKTFRVDYHDGEKYPHLERDAAKPDLLAAIIQARS
ncbi:MAG: M61 family peptidase [Acidobacteriota bacterium]|nr:M61 family peptidase [Acidobacteriota bacterium]